MGRCLYNSSFEQFINIDDNSIFGTLCDNYHGASLTTTREAWKEEISIIKSVLSNYADKNGQVIFEYDIPRLGKQDLIKYMLNAYRVLLTRARAGMVICVPKGNANKNPSGFWEDNTRLPEYYNGTYEYLKSLGIEEI